MNKISQSPASRLSQQLAAHKQALRRSVLALRDGLNVDERQHASHKACDWALWAIGIHCHDSLGRYPLTLEHCGSDSKRPVIGLFWPIRSEIDCLLLEPALRRAGMDVALPFVLNETEIEFRLWQKEAPLVKAGFGTQAPSEAALVVHPDLILVPLVGFDAARNRLGYGAGFYDRYLAKLIKAGHHPRLYGYAYTCQKLDKVPVGRYDQPLDCIITEDGLI